MILIECIPGDSGSTQGSETGQQIRSRKFAVGDRVLVIENDFDHLTGNLPLTHRMEGNYGFVVDVIAAVVFVRFVGATHGDEFFAHHAENHRSGWALCEWELVHVD